MLHTSVKRATLHRLLAPQLPVPRLLFAAAENPIKQYPYMLREWIDDERLEIVAPELSPSALMQFAGDIGDGQGSSTAHSTWCRFPRGIGGLLALT
jgi:hypothetical protein